MNSTSIIILSIPNRFIERLGMLKIIAYKNLNMLELFEIYIYFLLYYCLINQTYCVSLR